MTPQGMMPCRSLRKVWLSRFLMPPHCCRELCMGDGNRKYAGADASSRAMGAVQDTMCQNTSSVHERNMTHHDTLCYDTNNIMGLTPYNMTCHKMTITMSHKTT